MRAEAHTFDVDATFVTVAPAYGVPIMLTLFASCRLFPLIRTWRFADTSGDPILINTAPLVTDLRLIAIITRGERSVKPLT